MLRYILLPAFFIFNLCFSTAQFHTAATDHYLLGVNVKGYEIDLPFSKDKSEESWKEYAKDFGKSEETQSHKTYQTKFRTDIYPNDILVYSQIKGNKEQSTIWAGIDPQGIPKDVYSELQKALEEFVYNFNIKMRTDLAQQKIDESEQAATYLSKEFENLKKDERKNQRNFDKTNEKLVELRSDSTQYSQNLQRLKTSIDSLYIELEKVKAIVETYKERLEDIK